MQTKLNCFKTNCTCLVQKGTRVPALRQECKPNCADLIVHSTKDKEWASKFTLWLRRLCCFVLGKFFLLLLFSLLQFRYNNEPLKPPMFSSTFSFICTTFHFFCYLEAQHNFPLFTIHIALAHLVTASHRLRPSLFRNILHFMYFVDNAYIKKKINED